MLVRCFCIDGCEAGRTARGVIISQRGRLERRLSVQDVAIKLATVFGGVSYGKTYHRLSSSNPLKQWPFRIACVTAL
jgi:hypothetical protein